MAEHSLQQAMDNVLGQIGSICTASPSAASHKALSELEAFIHFDPLLAKLHKDFLSAKAYRKQLVVLYGDNDPLVDAALDHEDSAWAMMQTRYLELRLDGELMRRVQRLMRESAEMVDRAKEQREKEKALEFSYHLRFLHRMRERHKTPRLLEIWFIFILLGVDPLTMTSRQRTYDNKGVAV